MIRDLTYLKASTAKEALELLDEHKENCKVICGGQSLLILMRQGLVSPKYLVDIKHVEELNFITFDPNDGLRIGAATTHRSIEKSPLIENHYPVLVEMEKNLASIQTRNWGTIGGNLAHADPAGDPGTLLIGLKAAVKVANKQRERTLPLEEFFVDYFETSLEESELLIEIRVPVIPKKTAAVYEKFNIIKNDLAVVSVAASITLDDDGQKCREARIVLGASAPTPKRAKEAEKILIGRKLDDLLLGEAAQKASEEAEPVADIHASEEYRRSLVKALTKKVVKKSWEQARVLA